jgi:hypothetical protein
MLRTEFQEDLGAEQCGGWLGGATARLQSAELATLQEQVKCKEGDKKSLWHALPRWVCDGVKVSRVCTDQMGGENKMIDTFFFKFFEGFIINWCLSLSNNLYEYIDMIISFFSLSLLVRWIILLKFWMLN